MSMPLDSIDRRILELLQENGSLSVSELADCLGMTPPPCWRRVRRLKEAKILQRQVWLVDAKAVGLNVTIYASVKLETHDSQATAAFRRRVQTLPEVLECYILLGSPDALLKIVVSDMSSYEKFFYSRLSQIPGVREVSSSVVMSEVKKTTHIPLSGA
ncbi:MAG: Lrp/AsnC family transcriptional regulator [Proteobacteria bacterium]|nr:Lrp/AsnC family transcriptional regulator [Pseudomonadota bacterium]